MRMTMSSVALVGLLTAIPVTISAQTATTEAPEQPDAASTDTVAPDATAEAEPTVAPETPVEGQIILQSENSILAKDLLGASVYTSADETVGDINDMIINLDGTVEGVVIGVGGFLGIGEKEVAIEMSSLTLDNVDPANAGAVRLVLNATREELEAAPAFKSAVEQQRENEAEALQNQAESGALDPTVPAAN